MNELQKMLDQAGKATVALKLVDQHVADETKEANEVIQAVKNKYKAQIERLKKSSNDARVRLQEAIDNGQVPELGVETDDWKLVLVKRSNPLLENFDLVPDEFLLPVTQWIDWKKVDDAVRTTEHAPPGFGLVYSQSPRVMANQKVKV